MKFCEKCGKEILDDATFCPHCGCTTTPKQAPTPDNNIKTGKKRTPYVIIISVICATVLLIGGFFAVQFIRQVNVINALSGKSFSYYDYQSFPSLGKFYTTTKRIKFDDNGKMTYYYFYSSTMDQPREYETSYTIKFKKGMTLLIEGDGKYEEDEFEIQYDKYGRITGLYNIIYDELYD